MGLEGIANTNSTTLAYAPAAAGYSYSPPPASTATDSFTGSLQNAAALEKPVPIPPTAIAQAAPAPSQAPTQKPAAPAQADPRLTDAAATLKKNHYQLDQNQFNALMLSMPSSKVSDQKALMVVYGAMMMHGPEKMDQLVAGFNALDGDGPINMSIKDNGNGTGTITISRSAEESKTLTMNAAEYKKINQDFLTHKLGPSETQKAIHEIVRTYIGFAGGAVAAVKHQQATAAANTSAPAAPKAKPAAASAPTSAPTAASKPASAPVSVDSASKHTVKTGESFWSIAAKQLGDGASDAAITKQAQVLMQINPKLDPRKIAVGTEINLVAPNKMDPSAEAIARYERSDAGYAVGPGSAISIAATATDSSTSKPQPPQQQPANSQGVPPAPIGGSQQSNQAPAGEQQKPSAINPGVTASKGNTPVGNSPAKAYSAPVLTAVQVGKGPLSIVQTLVSGSDNEQAIDVVNDFNSTMVNLSKASDPKTAMKAFLAIENQMKNVLGADGGQDGESKKLDQFDKNSKMISTFEVLSSIYNALGPDYKLSLDLTQGNTPSERVANVTIASPEGQQSFSFSQEYVDNEFLGNGYAYEEFEGIAEQFGWRNRNPV